MAVVCDESCCDGVVQQVVVAQPGSHPVTVMRVSSALGKAGGQFAVAGGGRLLLVARDTVDGHGRAKERTVYRIDGGRAGVLDAAVPADEPWLVSHGLLLVVHDSFGATQPSFLYDGRDIHDESDGGPGVLDGRRPWKGHPGGTEGVNTGVCSIGQGTTLGGVSGGYVTYTTADAVHVIRMSDCRDALIADGPGIPAGSAITPAGLFYAFTARPFAIADTNATMARIHSTLTFLPMARVEGAINRGLKLGGRD
jgi:hypothetical protein